MCWEEDNERQAKSELIIVFSRNDQTFSFVRSNMTFLTLSKSAVDKIISNRADILSDLQNIGNDAVKRYWSDDESTVLSTLDCYPIYNNMLDEDLFPVKKRVLDIRSQFDWESVTMQEVRLDLSNFQLFLLLVKVYDKVQRDNCTYSLPNTKQCLFCSSKTLKVNIQECTFSVSDVAETKTFSQSLTKLAKIINLREKINYNWVSDVFQEFKHHDIFICQHAFCQILVCVGEPVWKDAPSTLSISNWNEAINITSNECIQFSFNYGDIRTENFTVINNSLHKNISLPIRLLEILFYNRWDILTDLKDYNDIPDYSIGYLAYKVWSNEKYAVGLDIDGNDNVIRFIAFDDDSKRKITLMVLRESDFRKLLEVYKSYREHVKNLMFDEFESRNGSVYDLDSFYKIIFKDEHIAIINKTFGKRYKVPFTALIELTRNHQDILDYLKRNYVMEYTYWMNKHLQIKIEEVESLRSLKFFLEHENLRNTICMETSTFKKLLSVLEGEKKQNNASQCSNIRINAAKVVETGSDLKKIIDTVKLSQNFLKRRDEISQAVAVKDKPIPAKQIRFNCEEGESSNNISTSIHDDFYNQFLKSMDVSDSVDELFTTDEVAYENCCIVTFDLETTGFSPTDQIVQIAAVYGDKTFNVYISPTKDMTPKASEVTGIYIMNNNMYVHGKNVETHSARNGFDKFLLFLASLKKPCILSAHNGFSFDAPRIIKLAKSLNLMENLMNYVEGFSDTLPIFKSKLVERTRQKKSFKLTALADDYLEPEDRLAPHDALNDVLILQKLVKVICKQDTACIINSVRSTRDMQETVEENKAVKIRENTLSNLGISNHMKKKIAKAGIHKSTLQYACRNDGLQGLTSLLGKKVEGKPVTADKKIIECIFNDLKN